MIKVKLTIFFILGIGCLKGKAQLIAGPVDAYIAVTNVLVGKGIFVTNISYTGDKLSCGFFENGLTSKLKMDAGIILSSGLVAGAKGPNNTDQHSTLENKVNGSTLLDQYAGGQTYSSATIQFDFKPQTEDISFNYIFASEEYIEYVDKNVSDIFGFFISGPGITGEENVALVPGKSIPVSIDNINHLRNTQFFNYNTLGEKTLQCDGFTTILTANLKLIPCEIYTIKLAIADVGDAKYDSWVFIEAGSFQHKTSLGRDTFICKENFDIELDAGNPTKSVSWRATDMNGKRIPIQDSTSQKIMAKYFGIYEVTVFTDCGSFVARKKIFPGVADISLGPDTLYCGDTLSRLLEVKNRVFDTYLWSDGSSAETLNATKPGRYWLEVTRGGCSKRDTVNLYLEPKPVIQLGKDTVVCGEVDLWLNVKETGHKYIWYKNRMVITGETDIRLRVTSPAQYAVESVAANCSNKDSIIIGQRPKLDVDIGLPLHEICSNDTVNLKTGYKDTGSYPTLWSNGRSSSSITVSAAGKYSVLVRDKLCNFTASDSTWLTVYDGAGNIWIPNAFTPSLEGLNCTFKPVTDIKTFNYYKFLVYNRWGEKLFETSDPQAAWDGFFNHTLCQNDVYIWSLNVKSNCSKGDNNFQRGIVHLIR